MSYPDYIQGKKRYLCEIIGQYSLILIDGPLQPIDVLEFELR